jgi:hypothetical protein
MGRMKGEQGYQRMGAQQQQQKQKREKGRRMEGPLPWMVRGVYSLPAALLSRLHHWICINFYSCNPIWAKLYL